MADRSITIRIGANVQGFTAALATARKSAEDFGRNTMDWAQRNNQAIGSLSTTVGVAGLALTGFAALAVKKFADFDAAMSNVQAATMESAANMDLLRDAALEAGQRTVYSATEAADAIENLAKAGVSTADILAGGLDGALDLAAAGTMNVGEAAEIAASAMTQFNLSGSDVTHVADLLAAGAGKAQGEVTDMGQALRQVGTVANQMGLDLDETVGSLTAFASAGITGSDAGTSFRAMLLRLANPTKESADLMAELGINAYDAQGNFVGMAGLAGQLERQLKGLTQEQRNAALAQIFGMDAIRTASLLYEQGAAGIEEWTRAVDDQGYAADVAATRLDNLKGDLEQLSGATETALIGLGEAGDGPLRGVVQGATDVVNAFADMPDAVQGGTLAIVGGGGLAMLGVAGMGKLVTGISDAKTAMQNLGISAKTATIATAGIGAALGIAAIGVTSWAQNVAEAKARTQEFQDTLDEFGNVTDATMDKINDALSSNQNDFIDNLVGKDSTSLIDKAEKFGLAIEDLQGYILGEADALDRVTEARERYVEANAGDSSRERRQAEDDFAWLTDRLDDQANALTDAEKAAAQKARADDAAADSAQNLGDATQYVGQTTEDATRILDEWRQAVSDADAAFISLTDAYDAQVQKNTEWAQSVADSTEDAEDDWQDYYDGVSVSADDYIAQLQAQVDAQAAWEQNMLDISARVKETLPADMQEAANAMIDELLGLGPEGAAQVQLLHDMTDEQFAQVVTLWGQKGTDAVSEFVTQVESYRQPVVEVTADLSSAYSQVESFIRAANGMLISVNADGQQIGFRTGSGAQPGFADGGYTGNVPTTAVAGVVHGREFVVKAGPADAYRPLLEAINSGRGYARGGYVEPVIPAPISTTAQAAVGGPLIGSMPVYGVTDPDALVDKIVRRLQMRGA